MDHRGERFDMGVGFSRRIAHVAAISFVLLVCAISWQAGAETTKAAAARSVSELVATYAVRDSDGDGTPDWKESIARTNPEDGSSHPVTAAPETMRVTLTPSTETSPLENATGAFWATIATGYYSLASQNAYTPERGEALAQTIADSMRADVVYKKRVARDLTVDKDNSPSRVQKYRDAMRVALAPLMQNNEPGFAVYARFVQNEDPAALQEMAEQAKRYRESEALLLKVQVPESAVHAHLAVLNGFEYYASVLDAFAKYGKDYVAGLQLLKTYNDAEDDVMKASQELNRYYAQILK